MLIQIDGLGSGRTLGRIPELRVSAQSGLRSVRHYFHRRYPLAIADRPRG